MGRKSRVEKKDRRVDGESPYHIKQKGRTPGTRSRKYCSNFHSETMKTFTGIPTRTNYFNNPIGLQIVSHAKQRNIYSLFINKNDKNMYLLKQSGYYHEGKGRGMTSSTPTFRELYDIKSWLTPQGKIELNAIEETLREKRKSIEKHLGMKLNLD